MNLYQLDISSKAHRQIKQVLPESKRIEVTQAILDLREVPSPPNSQLERELSDRHRLKINGWRVIYKVNEQDRVIVVLSVRKRTRNTYLNVP